MSTVDEQKQIEAARSNLAALEAKRAAEQAEFDAAVTAGVNAVIADQSSEIAIQLAQRKSVESTLQARQLGLDARSRALDDREAAVIKAEKDLKEHTAMVAALVEMSTAKSRHAAVAAREQAVAAAEAEWKTKTDFIEAMRAFLRGEGPAP